MAHVHRIAGSYNCHSCQFANKRAQREYFGEGDIVLCIKYVVQNCFSSVAVIFT